MSLYRIIKNPVDYSGSRLIIFQENHKNEDLNYNINNIQEQKDDLYAKGYEDGFKEAQKKFIEKEQQIIKKVYDENIKYIKNILKKIIKKYRENNLKTKEILAKNNFLIIKNILKDFIKNEELLKQNIFEALKAVDEKEIEIQLSANDYIKVHEVELLKEISNEEISIIINENKELNDGDVIIKTKTKIINATIDEKINNAINYLTEGNLTPETSLISQEGIVSKIVGNTIEVDGMHCSVGDICEIITDNNSRVKVEVVGYKDKKNLMMPLEEIKGIGPNNRVKYLSQQFEIKLGLDLLGRVLDGLGNPIDEESPIKCEEKRVIYGKPISPMDRQRIKERFNTGIKAIDILFTCGKGQRMGIFSGSGVGKSTLMGMMARYTSSDVNVIALIGERGREIKDFIERDLKEEGLKKSVVIAATSDKSPMERAYAALVAATIAEYFKDKKLNVLFMMDSVTRYAQALREIGLATGEPPSTKGYTPSVFSKIPKLLERSGNFLNGGCITGFYTVLVEGDDMTEPVADALRSTLDGHIVLSRKLAERNHYPAIDIKSSISRLMPDIVDNEHLKIAGEIKEIYSIISDMEDLINIGAYKTGSNPKVDFALKVIDELNNIFKQVINEKGDIATNYDKLKKLLTKGAKK